MTLRLDTDRIDRNRRADNRSRSHQRKLNLDEFSSTLRSASPLTDRLLERAVTADRLRSELAGGADLVAALTRNELDDLDADLANTHPNVDASLRSLFLAPEGRHAAEFPFEARAMGATAHGQVAQVGFSPTFWGAAVARNPLLDFCTVITTSNGQDHHFGFTSVDVTSNGIIAQGGAIGVTDATFANKTFVTYKYAQLLRVSAEMFDDPALDVESLAAARVANVTMRDFMDDAIAGDGSSKPTGLASGVLTTVASASAGALVLDDIGKLLEAVPAAYTFGGNCAILLSPGAYWDVRRSTEGTAAAGGMSVDATLPYIGGRLLGFPFAVDTALAAPATAAVSAIAGDFRQGSGVRLAPLRIESDRRGALASDEVLTRIILRADAQPLVTDALRALVGP